MSAIIGSEYEYARSLVFFGFMCGLTFAALIVALVNLWKGR
jgi:hypothetical protein